MIKRLAPRGISRVPSDKVTNDGMVAESLNMHIDKGENAPVLSPKDMTTDLSLSSADQYVYIHRENFISVEEKWNGNILQYRHVRAHVRNGEDVSVSVILDLGTTGQTLGSVTSIGNTLIVTTNRDIYYLLLKDGQYHLLGSEIPDLEVAFEMQTATSTQEYDSNATNLDSSKPVDACRFMHRSFSAISDYNDIYALNFATWTRILSGLPVEGEMMLGYQRDVNEIEESLWGSVSAMVQFNRALGYFCAPVLARAAYKLYDGSYVKHTVPILLGAGVNRWLSVSAVQTMSGEQHDTTFSVSMPIVYRVGMTGGDIPSAWADIIKSVDIFLSPSLFNPNYNQVFGKMIAVGGFQDDPAASPSAEFFFKGENAIYNANGSVVTNAVDMMKDELLSKVNFYKVDSLIERVMNKTLEPKDQDELLVQQRLPDDYRTNHHVIPSADTMAYNQRLIFGSYRTILSRGYYRLNGVSDYTGGYGIPSGQTGSHTYLFKFYVMGDDGRSYRVNRDITQSGRPFGVIFYPDSRCNKVDIYIDGNKKLTLAMAEHPGLNCAYAYWGLDKTIWDAGTYETVSSVNRHESREVNSSDSLVVSEASNPFFFPAEGMSSFSSKVITVATATQALSEGQFGAYPLYVFTRQGIWAMQLNDVGLPVSSKPLSRDVAIDAKGVTPIDQAVVFITERGVMMLAGSSVECLSPDMNGEHSSMAAADTEWLIGTRWEFARDIISDTTPFMDFMHGAEAVYDYPGRRLVFFNRDESYQYVYKIDSQTWHKMSIGAEGYTYLCKLNSYPECYVSASYRTGGNALLNLSSAVRVSNRNQPTIPGVIITRAEEFDQLDVYKTINRIRVHGYYDYGDVRWILFGSNDLKNYRIIHSLRGPSMRYFKLVLLVDIQATERLSYIDVDFEPRFTNKIR